jgi:hypothetical protein
VIRKRPEKDVVTPPGQIVNRPQPGPDTLLHNIEEYKRYEKEKNARSGEHRYTLGKLKKG